jgi:rhodanese-related sulfurtransferase
MSIQNIKPNLVQDMLKSGALFLDVREKNETECNKYDLPNVTYLPLSEFDKKFMAILPQDKNAKIILACQAGGRSMMAAGFLEKNGYQNLYNLEGGLTFWSTEGLPTTGEPTVKSDCCSKPGCC